MNQSANLQATTRSCGFAERIGIPALLVLLCGLVLCACRSGEGTREPDPRGQQAHNEPNIEEEDGPSLAPNTCLLYARVVEIDPTRDSLDRRGPCATVPCRAGLEIESVEAYGAAFPDALSAGMQIAVTFEFGTADTRESMPELSGHFPGVQVGSRIKALLHSRESPDGGTLYSIFDYRVY